MYDCNGYFWNGKRTAICEISNLENGTTRNLFYSENSLDMKVVNENDK